MRMAGLVRFLLQDTGVWTLVLALLLGALQTRRQGSVSRWSEASLLWIAFWVMGVAGLYGFIAHLLFAPFIAEQIGWPNSPFQFEVAYANLTVSILGFSSFGIGNATICWRRWSLQQLVLRRRRWSCGVACGRQQPGTLQCGERAYTDLLTPVVVVLLLWFSRHERRRLT